MSLRGILLAVLATCLLQGQEFRSTLTGRVTDPSGAVVPGAKVEAVKTDTNSHFSTVSNAEGLYSLPMLPPGPYAVSAEASGFKKYVQAGIQISTNGRVAQDITLSVGSSTESVTITAEAPQLESVTASSGQVVTTHEVEDLPLNGRTPLDVAFMGFGVNPNGTRDNAGPGGNGGLSDISMGGTASGANAFLLDGVPNTGTLGTTGLRPAFNPALDAVSEVRVEVFSVDASSGGAGGGSIAVVTKGGTNQLHGSASEFNQASALAATPFFTNSAGQKKPVYRQNQAGATVGGPVIIPKLFNGRDKLFFFYAYDYYMDSAPAVYNLTVPTAAERQGDFSSLLALGANYTLYDPATARQSGTTVTRQPFASNMVPQSRINAVAANQVKLFGQPNQPGTRDGANNYITSETEPTYYHSHSIRGDVNVSNNNKFTSSLRTSLWYTDAGDLFHNKSLGSRSSRSQWNGTADDVHTFSPTMVANLRFGVTRFQAYANSYSVGTNPTSLGYPANIAASAGVQVLPTSTFSDGYSSLGGGANNNLPYNIYQAFSSVTKITGLHTIKAGVEIRRSQYSNMTFTDPTGSYTFDSTWVKATNTAALQPLGGSMAAFLLGLPTTGTYVTNAASTSDSYYDVVFLQDDWRARPNLSLNLGLRWEYTAPTVERWNRQVVGLDAGATNKVTQTATAAYANNPISQLPASAFNPVGGLIFATQDRRAATNMTHKSFSPRLGLSWTPTVLGGRTVLRAGLGMFDFAYGVMPGQQPGFSYTNPYVATNDSYLTPATTLSNPYPSGFLPPPGATLGVNTNLGQSLTYLNPNLGRQYSLRWEFLVQQQLAKDTVLEVGYIGNHAVHLTTNYNFGALPAKYLSTLPVRDNATNTALGAVVASPFAGLIPGTTLNGSTITVQNLLRPFPEFSGVTMQNMNNGGSYFHQIAMRLQKRFSKGVVFFFNAQHSRLMEQVTYPNAGSLVLEKRVSNVDHPNRISFNGSYQLPIGRGHYFLPNGNRVLVGILGNWTAAFGYSFYSGRPLAWGNVIYNGGDLNYQARNVDHSFDTTRFNTVSNQQLVTNYRTFPTQFNNLRADNTNNLNVTMTKNFFITEKIRLQVRGDSFNVCNRPLFDVPNLSPTNSAFGVITNMTNKPRAIQLGMRLTF